jgi:hypothetical protein
MTTLLRETLEEINAMVEEQGEAGWFLASESAPPAHPGSEPAAAAPVDAPEPDATDLPDPAAEHGPGGIASGAEGLGAEADPVADPDDAEPPFDDPHPERDPETELDRRAAKAAARAARGTM